MAGNRTLTIVKPDAFGAGKAGKIIAHLEGEGFRVRAARAPAGGGAATVRDVMTRQVLCVSPDQPVVEVASLMTNKDVDRVPVVRDGQLVGLLTRGDIVRKLIGTQ